MPQGVVATVDDGFATLDFIDPSLRGPALNALLDIGGPESIETITRKGPRRQYRVPEGNAREAGLIDAPAEQARGLDASGNPDTSTLTGPTGNTVTTTDDVGANDTGWATALVNADPNTGSDVSTADGLAAQGTVDFHTPTAEYTSAHGYVGKVPNANVLHNRAQVVTGTGTSVGGTMAHPPRHSEIIDYVKTHSTGFQRTEGTREPEVPAAVVSNALASQPAALGSDPGGFAPQPAAAPAPGTVKKRAKRTRAVKAVPVAPPAPAPVEIASAPPTAELIEPPTVETAAAPPAEPVQEAQSNDQQ